MPADFVLNCLLSIFGWFPGQIHAIYYIITYEVILKQLSRLLAVGHIQDCMAESDLHTNQNLHVLNFMSRECTTCIGGTKHLYRLSSALQECKYTNTEERWCIQDDNPLRDALV